MLDATDAVIIYIYVIIPEGTLRTLSETLKGIVATELCEWPMAISTDLLLDVKQYQVTVVCQQKLTKAYS